MSRCRCAEKFSTPDVASDSSRAFSREVPPEDTGPRKPSALKDNARYRMNRLRTGLASSLLSCARSTFGKTEKLASSAAASPRAVENDDRQHHQNREKREEARHDAAGVRFHFEEGTSIPIVERLQTFELAMREFLK